MTVRTLSVFVLLSAVCFAAPNGEGFLGRWDLTVTAARGEYPSWLEVARSDGKLAARFVGRSGSVRPAPLEIVGGELRFKPEQQGRNAKTPNKESYTARLVGGRLEGTGTDNQGNALKWVGERVTHPAGPPREPRWGAPITLFDGRNLDGWTFKGDRGQCWSVAEGALVNTPPCPNLYTSQKFRDFKLHVEYNLDLHSNSGVYLRGRYEVQIEDQGPRELEEHGVGSIYGFIAPTLKAAKAAGEWQTFDITLAGYYVTVVFNSKTIISRQEIPGITGGALDSHEDQPGPIMLQGDHGRVRFRNITVTPGN